MVASRLSGELSVLPCLLHGFHFKVSSWMSGMRSLKGTDITYNTDKTYLLSHIVLARNVGHTQIWVIHGGLNTFAIRCEQMWGNH